MLLLLLACASSPPTDLWFGGDLYYGDRDPAELLAPLAPLVKGALGVVNLEGPADGGIPTWTDPDGRVHLHNAPHRITPALGLLAVGVQNNHRADAADPEAADRTLLADGVTPLGSAVLRVGALRVAMMQVDLAPTLPETFSAEAKALRAEADTLVVGFHVRGPASYLPGPGLRAAVAAAQAAGATVIVAHGTHALGPVEQRGDTVVAWGLGNVAMVCDCTEETDAMLLRVRLGADGQLVDVDALPIHAGLRGEPAAPSSDPEGILDLLAALGSTPMKRHGVQGVPQGHAAE